MPVSIHTPSPMLAEYISYYYCIDEKTGEGSELKKKIPDGTVELYFHYGNPFYKVSSDGRSELIEKKSLLLGQMHDFMEFRSIGHIGFIGVKFRANGFQPFLGDRVSLFTDKIIDLNDLWGSSANTLEDCMSAAKSTDERVRLLEDFLLKKIKGSSDKLIDHCTRLITERNGNMKVSDLSAKVNLSLRQLERRFLDAVGITPNCFSRIMRVQKALQKIENNDYNSLTQLCYDSGFYDQSHMIKEITRFAGVSPKAVQPLKDCYGKTSFM